nr:IS30 family transposase [Eubacteriales bacterium]
MKQLTLSDRVAIKAGLCTGKTLKKIAEDIGRNPTTISREIKTNRSYIHGSFYLNNDCKYARRCTQKHVCTDKYCETPCVKCRNYDCREGCPRYTPLRCSRIEKPPYVCNRCPQKDRCNKNRYIYSARLADAASSRRRSDTRRGVRLTEEQLKSIDNLVTKQIKKGQPLTHIYAEHQAELPISLRSLYNYIDSGMLTVRNIDLRRKVSYKPRKRTQKRVAYRNQDFRTGRTYGDFQKYIENHPNCSIVQMDTVLGTRTKGQRILTMLFLKTNIMLMFLIPDGKGQTVVDVFDFLLNILDMDTFKNLFQVILTDNGSEFKRAEELEFAPYTGERRCRVFYCDPMASWQKAEIEKNHEFIRYVIPKGKSLDGYNHNDIKLLMNHINSVKRPGLDNRCPYELVSKDDNDMKWLMELMGMDTIPADDVHLNPSLLTR